MLFLPFHICVLFQRKKEDQQEEVDAKGKSQKN